MYVTIGCKLPHGPMLEVGSILRTGKPGAGYQSIVLNGVLNAPRGATYGSTKVSYGLWSAWLKRNHYSRSVQDGSIFIVPDPLDAKLTRRQ